MIKKVAEDSMQVNALPSTSGIKYIKYSTANPYPLETLYYLTNVYVSPAEAEAERRR